MKKCPYCAEDIQEAAIACKHCGRDLEAGGGIGSGSVGPRPRSRQRLGILLGILAVLAMVVLAQRSNANTDSASVIQQAMAREYVLVDSNGVEIDASHYFYNTFEPPNGSSCTLKGRVVGLAGGNKDFEVVLVDDDGFTNLKNGTEGRSYFSSGRTSAVTLSVGPLSPRRYHLVVSNAFSLVSAKTVQLDRIRLSCL